MLLFSRETQEPLGTGFFVTEDGDFVTTYHVLSLNLDNATRISCQWNGHRLAVQLIRGLQTFYEKLDRGAAQTDLILLKARIPNKNLRSKPLPVNLFDANAQIPALLRVWGKGFRTEGRKHWGDAELCPFKVNLETYHKENGTWSCTSERPIFKGFSGSPAIIEGAQEAMGVVVRRAEEERPLAIVQSLHMLGTQLEACGYDCSRLRLTPRSLYGQYRRIQSTLFERDDWPYAIDKEVFVNAFDYETARFPLDKVVSATRYGRCIRFAAEQLSHLPVFCIGNYGMGKTTISKFLFAEYTSYSPAGSPIFIPLSGKRLPEPHGQNAHDFAIEQLYQTFRQEQRRAGWKLDISDELLRGYLRAFVRDNQVVLILDGIDEAIIPSRASLTLFAHWLKSLDWTYFLTSRKEFHAFFELVGREMVSCDHVVIELKSWGPKQWDTYASALSTKYRHKVTQVDRLRQSLNSRAYGDLPERPLFLKMISDLELNDETYLGEIPPELRDNKAEIYCFYLKWKIQDDYERKQGKFHVSDRRRFTAQCFELFRRLAAVEYARSSPRESVTRPDGSRVDTTDALGYSGFTEDDVAQACDGLWMLRAEFVLKHLSGSPFFSMIQARIGNGEEELYRFSHKSFCEYLFAYDLAETIFRGPPERAECGREWDLYQTFEVSAFFKDEIERRRIRQKLLSLEQISGYLQSAFEKEFLARTEFSTYSERLEEVLYYTGRFAVRSPKILSVLKQIVADPIGVHAVYYRTAHIALAFSESIDYCIKYVAYLIHSYHSDRKAFQLDSEIQANYYGKGNLHKALKMDIDAFIQTGESDAILPLRLFSYFTCLPFGTDEIDQARQYLADVKDACNRKKCHRMSRILGKVGAIMEEISRVAAQ
ncbi:MAG: hypothetical protein GXY19_20610 [Phycisphaerae bacterium]|nr:hypothetical protein [Phycisphaerae bacterium]